MKFTRERVRCLPQANDNTCKWVEELKHAQAIVEVVMKNELKAALSKGAKFKKKADE